MLSAIRNRIERLEALLPEDRREPTVAWVIDPTTVSGLAAT
jgi:hypothetical protein